MRSSHRLIFWLIAILALGTFAFGVLQLAGARRPPVAQPPPAVSK